MTPPATRRHPAAARAPSRGVAVLTPAVLALAALVCLAAPGPLAGQAAGDRPPAEKKSAARATTRPAVRPATRPAAVRPPAPRPPNPALARVPDDPALPRVLLIGDSISMGYTVPVRERLKGKANVHRPTTNAGPTSNGVQNLDAWLAAANTGGPSGRKWDAIHFNFGLHDLKYADEKGTLVDVAKGKPQIPPADYERNLREIVKRLKATGAALVWCSTTPVPEGSAGRVPGDDVKYNEIAARVMKEAGVPTNDLYAFAKPRLAEIQRPANVHFSDKGSEALAEQVAAAVEKALAERKAVGKGG